MIKKTILLLSTITSLGYSFDAYNPLGLKDGGWGGHYNVPKIAVPGLLLTGLIMGNDSRLGNTVWKSIDSMLIGGVITEIGKAAFGRVRPEDSWKYDKQWFQSGNKSLPSGHVSSMASIVSPFVFEYAEEEPLVHLLWLLPAHQVFGRVNDKRHYMSDALAGFGVGVLSGWLVSDFKTPLTLSWKEGGIYAGIEFDF